MGNWKPRLEVRGKLGSKTLYYVTKWPNAKTGLSVVLPSDTAIPSSGCYLTVKSVVFINNYCVRLRRYMCTCPCNT